MTDDAVSALTAADEQCGGPLNSSEWKSWDSRVAVRGRGAPLLMTLEAIITMTQTTRKSLLLN